MTRRGFGTFAVGWRVSVAAALSLVVAALAFWAAKPSAAQGRAPEDRYIASRDAVLARLKRAAPSDEKVMAEEVRATADLERQMQAIIGTIEIKGLGAGKLNLGSLFEGDLGYGSLDGLLFSSEDYKTKIAVTTRPLLTRWLRAHRDLWPDEKRWREPEAVFRIETFYFNALMSDAAILKFAEVPLGAGASKPAFAMMGARTQDAIPYAANEVFVAAIKGDRVFVGNIALKEDFTVPACRAARAKTETSIKAMTEAQTGGGKDMSKTIEAAGAKAETDFRVCFAARAAKEPGFAAVVERAQELYALMPAR